VSKHMNLWRREKVLDFKYGQITVLEPQQLRRLVTEAQGYEESRVFAE